MTNKQIYFPYYSGNIKFTKCQGYISLDKFIYKHKKPSNKIANLFKQIKEAEKLGNKKEKRKLKQSLFSFTPSTIIPKGYKRKYDNIINYTGLMQCDFDGIENHKIAEDLKQYLFNDSKLFVAVYYSPSGNIKSLMKIDKPENKEDYKAIHKAVTNEFGGISYFDEATKNAILPLFLSEDKNILYRDYSECDKWTERDYSKPNYVNLNEEKTENNYLNKNDYYQRITIEIFSKKIKNIVDNGHPQLRNACLILGSRSSAGYISIQTCYRIAEIEVKNNSYFHKDLNNYLSTTRWAINQGYKNPKYY